MMGLNRKEKEKLVVELYENGKSYHEIAKEARISLRDIKGILDKANGLQSLSKSSQAYRMFSEGKSPTDVAIVLDMREPEVTQLYKESWTLKQIYDLNSIYLEASGDLGSFVKLLKLSKAAGLTAKDVIKLLLITKNDLPSMERKCQDLKREEADMTAKNLDAAGIFQQLSNDISEISKILDKYRSSCKEERLELAKLRLQKVKLESLVRHFQNNNEDFRRITELVNQAVRQSLTNHRHILKIAFLSIIDSCQKDPVKFNILYYNLPQSATTETRLAEFDMIDQCNGLSTNEQLCYQHKSANYIVYWRFLVGEAEKFFNDRVNELEQVCINRLTDVFTSVSISSSQI